uniref:Glycoside hydrolase family 5 domain-containing protein n=1 Tax=Acrobeloides nanus TaxID=290746 RepID=A0A914CEV5_9BILA
MSLYFSQWQPMFFNNLTIAQLKCYWNANIVRAVMGIEYGGYLENPETEYEKIKAVIEAAIENGIYVLVDWHEEHAYLPEHTAAAIQFFTNISATYGNYPHVIYEIFNEPSNATWEVIKAYHVKVIAAIRANDPDNVIVAGTPSWSSDVVAAAQDPINGTNIAYTFHFYAATDGQADRDRLFKAINMSLPVFVTEYGVVQYTGNGPINETSSQAWWDFLDQNLISYVNWSIETNNETAAALIANTTAAQVGDKSRWTYGGAFVNKMLWSKDQGLVCSAG